MLSDINSHDVTGPMSGRHLGDKSNIQPTISKELETSVLPTAGQGILPTASELGRGR